ncbi:MAG: hypothetical protein EOP04_20495 [Proteobacteria bacterium]|nr:MAG: hypothetical protein EOP04_20495 [Pseudomonadota bacterium]RZA27174.1 MAG: hypothetical protein EOP10_01100 [Pseudomonadota bacterium]
MNRKIFEQIISKIPHLTSEGLMDISDPTFAQKRRDFVRSTLPLGQTIAAIGFLSQIGKSGRFSRWQRTNCTPTNLQDLIEWAVGQKVSEGAIIVAAISLGFTMGVQDGTKAYFNFLVPQMEFELARFANVQQVRMVVGQ